ncbi:hypothetical protein EYZ11_005513 [Aspergillus tanneri]|uniref:Uncharacterized protein n=1 Tax=Aspergillus tanneri TaxID=1220188 RepID=A0A4S3JNR1_9EURO|nr:hypothetical protein EYZ11_005513 [Aspergillus tanneri]
MSTLDTGFVSLWEGYGSVNTKLAFSG